MIELNWQYGAPGRYIPEKIHALEILVTIGSRCSKTHTGPLPINKREHNYVH